MISEGSRGIEDQCWGKLLLKVMHYNIALFPKKVITLLSYFLWKVMNVQHSSAIKKQRSTIVNLSKVIFAY